MGTLSVLLAVEATGIGARGNPGSSDESCGLSQGDSLVPPRTFQAVSCWECHGLGDTGARVTPREPHLPAQAPSPPSATGGIWRGPWSSRRLPALPEHRDKCRHPEFQGAETAEPSLEALASPGSPGHLLPPGGSSPSHCSSAKGEGENFQDTQL